MTEVSGDVVVTGKRLGRDPDQLTILVQGQDVTGWSDVEVTLRAEGFPNSFSVAASSHEPADRLLRASEPCAILLGDDLVITGYIDRDLTSGSPREHAVHLQGRGRTQDLVDCHAEWPTGQMIEGDALTIATGLAQPYGLAVKLGIGASAGERVPAWSLNFGETPAEIIQRVSRHAGLLAYEDASGSLLLATVGTRQAASGIVYGENVEAYQVENSVDGRFSEIVCSGLSMNTLIDLGGDTFYHREADPNVLRHRLMYLVVESVASDPRAFTVTKAKWEVARRAGRSAIVRATVDGWRDTAGALWMPNTLVPVSVPGRARELLVVSEVTFRRDNGRGTTADLTLMPSAAFTPEPIVLSPVSSADIVTAD